MVNLTYRNNGSYLKFRTNSATTNQLMNVNKEMNYAITNNKHKLFLRDDPAVKANQNVYDFLSD